MKIFIGKQEGLQWGAIWDPILLCMSVHGACQGTNLWSVYGNKTSHVQMTYRRQVPPPEVEKRWDILRSTLYVNGFHPNLNFTWVISDVHLPFLNLCVKPASDCLLTSIHYKETDTHSYLNYTSSHPASCKNSIPYNHFLCLGCICSEEDVCPMLNPPSHKRTGQKHHDQKLPLADFAFLQTLKICVR